MDQKKIDRINFLAKKAKSEGLTAEETAEQAVLRDEYRASFRASFTNIMDHTSIRYPDGSEVKVKAKIRH